MVGLTAKRLRQLLSYDPETGLFTRLVDRCKHRAGEIAGSISDVGYTVIGVDGKTYQASRLAVLWMTGEWPPNEVDHRDNDPQNNKWANLRPATRAEQTRNVRSKCNVLGFKGVTAHLPGPGNRRTTVRYQASIRIDGRQTYLGSFGTPEEAHAKYVSKAREVFGDFTNSGEYH